jgi:hypothetical protein
VVFFDLTRLGMNQEEVAGKLVYFIRDTYLKAGYSRVMTGHMNLRRQYVQAKTALDVGSRKKPYLWIHYFSQVAMTYILEQATKRLPGTMICHEGLLELKKHDEENQTQYMETLRVYLEQHLSATQAARELFIHTDSTESEKSFSQIWMIRRRFFTWNYRSDCWSRKKRRNNKNLRSVDSV